MRNLFVLRNNCISLFVSEQTSVVAGWELMIRRGFSHTRLSDQRELGPGVTLLSSFPVLLLLNYDSQEKHNNLRHTDIQT